MTPSPAGLPATSVTQVLLITDTSRYLDVIAPLWAAFTEVERCYAAANAPVRISRYLVSDLPPHAGSGQVVVPRLSASPVLEVLRRKARGRYTRTFDQEQMAVVVREMLALPTDDYLQLVVDVDITPPPSWRYIISDDVPTDSPTATVMSIVPTDPRHWQIEDADRLSRIKHRIRTACLGSLGEHMGVELCHNTRCVFFDNVDAVTRLDTMKLIGPEHPELQPIHNCGYEPIVHDPAVTQELSLMPPRLRRITSLEVADADQFEASIAADALDTAEEEG